jgi:hypothetical protein
VFTLSNLDFRQFSDGGSTRNIHLLYVIESSRDTNGDTEREDAYSNAYSQTYLSSATLFPPFEASIEDD